MSNVHAHVKCPCPCLMSMSISKMPHWRHLHSWRQLTCYTAPQNSLGCVARARQLLLCLDVGCLDSTGSEPENQQDAPELTNSLWITAIYQ